jgi:hypothetical protein
VNVLRVKANAFPVELQNDFIIWDSVCAYERRFSSRNGQIINFFMLESADIQHMESDYTTVRSLASAVETPTAGNL